MRRVWLFGLADLFIAVFTVLNVYTQQQHQFYPTCLYIAKSNACLVVVSSFILYLVFLFAWGMQKVLFGDLRVIEVEHLYENGWYSVSEIFLAMTVFKDDFDLSFVSFFTLLFIFKVYHWLLKDRLDYMEQTPAWTTSFKARIIICCTFFSLFDAAAVALTTLDLLMNGPSMQILFCFEYFILLINAMTYAIRYTLNIIESHYEATWNDKSKYLFYLELFTDFIKLSAYLLFFVVVINFYGLPLHIIRDLFMTLRSFMARIRDWIQYHRATANMDERYPDATPEEIAATDRLCIICREEMTAAKKLNCGHLFHVNCLRSWLERQQTCPTCRRPVLEQPAPAPFQRGQIGQVQINQPQQIPAQTPQQQPPQGQIPTDQFPGVAANELARRQQLPSSARAASPSTGGGGGAVQSRSENLGIPVIIIPHANLATPVDVQSTESVTTSLSNLVDILPSVGGPSVSQPSSPSIDHLTDAELAEMEGKLRQHALARIRFLQSIQKDISTIITKMTQYQQLLLIEAALNHRSHTSISPSGGASSSESQANQSTVPESLQKTRATVLSLLASYESDPQQQIVPHVNVDSSSHPDSNHHDKQEQEQERERKREREQEQAEEKRSDGHQQHEQFGDEILEKMKYKEVEDSRE